jgi:hypothetical protein
MLGYLLYAFQLFSCVLRHFASGYLFDILRKRLRQFRKFIGFASNRGQRELLRLRRRRGIELKLVFCRLNAPDRLDELPRSIAGQRRILLRSCGLNQKQDG